MWILEGFWVGQLRCGVLNHLRNLLRVGGDVRLGGQATVIVVSAVFALFGGKGGANGFDFGSVPQNKQHKNSGHLDVLYLCRNFSQSPNN